MKAIFTYPNNSGTYFIDPNYLGDDTVGYQKRVKEMKDGTYLTHLNTYTASYGTTLSTLIKRQSKYNNALEESWGQNTIYKFWELPIVDAGLELIESDISGTSNTGHLQEVNFNFSGDHGFYQGQKMLLSNFDHALAQINSQEFWVEKIDADTIKLHTSSDLDEPIKIYNLIDGVETSITNKSLTSNFVLEFTKNDADLLNTFEDGDQVTLSNFNNDYTSLNGTWYVEDITDTSIRLYTDIGLTNQRAVYSLANVDVESQDVQSNGVARFVGDTSIQRFDTSGTGHADASGFDGWAASYLNGNDFYVKETEFSAGDSTVELYYDAALTKPVAIYYHANTDIDAYFLKTDDSIEFTYSANDVPYASKISFDDTVTEQIINTSLSTGYVGSCRRHGTDDNGITAFVEYDLDTVPDPDTTVARVRILNAATNTDINTISDSDLPSGYVFDKILYASYAVKNIARLSNDGTTLAVNCIEDSTDDFKVAIFTTTDSWSTFTYQAIIDVDEPIERNSDEKSHDFKLSDDGDTLVFAYNDPDTTSSGFKIYTRSGSTWSSAQSISLGYEINSQSSFGMSRDASRFVFLRPNTGYLVYDKGASTWALSETITNTDATDAIYATPQLSGDGNTLVVSEKYAPVPGQSGSKYVTYVDSGSGFAEDHSIERPQGTFFGRVFKVSDDGLAFSVIERTGASTQDLSVFRRPNSSIDFEFEANFTIENYSNLWGDIQSDNDMSIITISGDLIDTVGNRALRTIIIDDYVAIHKFLSEETTQLYMGKVSTNTYKLYTDILLTTPYTPTITDQMEAMDKDTSIAHSGTAEHADIGEPYVTNAVSDGNVREIKAGTTDIPVFFNPTDTTAGDLLEVYTSPEPNIFEAVTVINSTTGTLTIATSETNRYRLSDIEVIWPGNKAYLQRTGASTYVGNARIKEGTYWLGGSSSAGFSYGHWPDISISADNDGYLTGTISFDTEFPGTFLSQPDRLFEIETVPNTYTPPSTPLVEQQDVWDTQDEWDTTGNNSQKRWPYHVSPASAVLRHDMPSSVTKSQGGTKYVKGSGFTRWQLEVTYPPMIAEDFRQFHATAQLAQGQLVPFLFILRNSAGASILLDYHNDNSILTPRIKDDLSVGEKTVLLEGFPSFLNNAVQQGEMILIDNDNGRLNTIAGDVQSNAYGEVLARFPYAQNSNKSRAQLTFLDPFSVVVTLADNGFEYSIDTAGLYYLTVTFDLDEWK